MLKAHLVAVDLVQTDKELFQYKGVFAQTTLCARPIQVEAQDFVVLPHDHPNACQSCVALSRPDATRVQPILLAN